MPSVRIFRARIDIGGDISGLIFSYDPIGTSDTQLEGKFLRIWQVERFYIETPPGYELVEIKGEKLVRDPEQGENVYMRAARVVSRVWQSDPRFRIIASAQYESLDRLQST